MRCIRILALTPDILTEDVCNFPQSLQANAYIVNRLGHSCVLENVLKYMKHLSSSHPTVHNLDTGSSNDQKSITYKMGQYLAVMLEDH
jgi:hypothetical protein